MSLPRNKVAWIINHYSTIPARDGTGTRHFRLAQELKSLGWDGILFLASTRHPSGEQWLPKQEPRRIADDQGVKYAMFRTPAYSGGVARARNMVMFATALLRPKATQGIPNPDLVVGSTVHLLAAWAALRLARRYGVPFVFEIRDIWPETLVDLGKLPGRHPIAALMRRLSRKLSAAANLVVSPLPGVRSYLDDLGLSKVPFVWVSNGVDTPSMEDPIPVPENDEFTFMYLGSHGNANGIMSLIDAFDLACSLPGAKRLRLRLVGDGTQKTALRSHAQTLASAGQISFEDRISRSEVLGRSREADALVVNIENLPVYRYGISLNKIFDYLASGRPTIIASSAANNPISESRSGIGVRAGDVAALASAMREMSDLPLNVRESMGALGVAHVRERYGYGALAKRLASALDHTLQNARRGRLI